MSIQRTSSSKKAENKGITQTELRELVLSGIDILEAKEEIKKLLKQAVDEVLTVIPAEAFENNTIARQCRHIREKIALMDEKIAPYAHAVWVIVAIKIRPRVLDQLPEGYIDSWIDEKTKAKEEDYKIGAPVRNLDKTFLGMRLQHKSNLTPLSVRISKILDCFSDNNFLDYLRA